MKKTAKEYNELLANFFGLKEGDHVKIKDEKYKWRDFIVIKKETGQQKLYLKVGNSLLELTADLDYLLDIEYEIVQKPQKVGETLCDEQGCEKCPLRLLDCFLNKGESTLYEMLDEVCECRNISKESNIYKAFKEMLDSDC